jgi:heme A synthase
MILNQSNTVASKVPAITTLGLLGVNAGLGATAMFGNQDNYPMLRIIHRSVGFAVFASALWLSIAVTFDNDVKTYVKGIGYGYTALTVVPVVIFTF